MSDDQPAAPDAEPTSEVDAPWRPPIQPLDCAGRPRREHRLEGVVLTHVGPKGRGRARLALRYGTDGTAREFSLAVRRGVPGDVGTVVIEGGRRRDLEGAFERLDVRSPDRVEPVCPHAGRREELGGGCGGCAMQALGYDAQLRDKREVVRRALARGGVVVHDEVLAPTLGMEEPWRYRNKMELSFGDDRERRYALGLRPAGYRREVIRLEACHLMSEASQRLVLALQRWAEARGLEPYKPWRLAKGVAPDGGWGAPEDADPGFVRTLTVRDGVRTGERLVELTTTGGGRARMDGTWVRPEAVAAAFAEEIARLGALTEADGGVAVTSVWWTRHVTQKGVRTSFDSALLAGADVLHEELHLPGLGPLRFAVHPRAFFQPNTAQAERLYHRVAVASGLVAEDGGAGPTLSAREEAGGPPLKVVDLYCGTGTIGLTLAARGLGSPVIGIELVEEAVANARANAARNGLGDAATFHAGDAGATLKVLGLDRPGVADVVIVDPPRAGLGMKAVKRLISMAPRRLVYVSCNPEALGRDLGALLEAGFVLRKVEPIDQFPHTAHVECVATLDGLAARGD